MSPLIDTATLAARMGDVRLFDASFYLLSEGVDARARFREAHLPGARFFDIDEIADPDSDLPHMVPSQARFARLVSALGVGDDDAVVVYDQKGIFSAARAWWLMRLFGHERVAVLDGGLPKWRAEGRPTEQGEPAPAVPGRLTVSFEARRLRGLGDMRRNAESGEELVLDARPADRFSGAAPEPRAGLPSGHMPGSASLPAASLLAPDGTMLPGEELRSRFAAVGADGSRPVVTSCGSGVTAAILTLGLVVAGLPEGALYDGSWTEWASDPSTPKVTL